MDEEFERDEFHSEISDVVQSISESFTDMLNKFEAITEELEDPEDVAFVGSGLQAFGELLERYAGTISQLDHQFHQKFIELKDNEARLARFEKQVLDSLEELPITDAFDAR